MAFDGSGGLWIVDGAWWLVVSLAVAGMVLAAHVIGVDGRPIDSPARTNLQRYPRARGARAAIPTLARALGQASERPALPGARRRVQVAPPTRAGGRPRLVVVKTAAPAPTSRRRSAPASFARAA